MGKYLRPRSVGPRRLLFALLALFGCLLWPQRAQAWLFHEHHEIGIGAVNQLSPARHRLLTALWSEWRAQVNHGDLLCQEPAAGSSRLKCSGAECPTLPGEPREISDCVDFAMLPAIAADHSCSPAELLRTVAHRPWLRDVIRISFETRGLLERAKDRAERLDAWHGTHIKNEMVDSQYLSRASGNDAHFMLARDRGDTLESYARRSIAESSEINAIGLYLAYHRVALELALTLSKTPEGAPGRLTLLQRTLAAEAFALHFLEDSFSAGHTVGTWGKAPDRMGTHDYYCEHGIDAETWSGRRYTAHGDGHLKPKDHERAAFAVASSLSQLLDAAAGDYSVRDRLPRLTDDETRALSGLDACKVTRNPTMLAAFASHPLALEVLNQTLRPALGSNDAHLPRFTNEVGAFVRFYSGIRSGGNFSGYQSPAPALVPRLHTDLEVGLAMGYGFEGIVTSSTDGVVFLQLSGVAAAREKDLACPSPCVDDRTHGKAGDRVPSRLGLGVRLRLPQLLLPADTLVLLPLVMAFDFQAGKQLGLMAADGGLFRLWKRIGPHQLILFREVGVNIYGALFGTPSFKPVNGEREDFTAVELDFPFYEYRPLRRFAERQTATGMLQVGTSVDLNPFETAYLVYVRFGFDGRLYL
ncbi:MAG: hypothetical protein KF915_20575 [Polyangiaceae bacterium]|nr:hypothetical protein [Polyangiaceae bacterium]